jgi:hypothetical protein
MSNEINNFTLDEHLKRKKYQIELIIYEIEQSI